MIPTPLCRHDGSAAVAAVLTPSGCVAFPADRAQFLCAQHLLSMPDGTADDYEIMMGLDDLLERMGFR